MNEQPLRILHAPTNVGGNPWGRSRAEPQLGHHSDVVVFDNNWLTYPCELDLQCAGRCAGCWPSSCGRASKASRHRMSHGIVQ